MEKQDFKYKNLPNQLTIARVCAIPLFIVLLLMGFRVAATIVFLAAALTDMLDGKIARRYNLVTNFGKLMDPLADKLLTMSAFVCLVELGDIRACVRLLQPRESSSPQAGQARSRPSARWSRFRCSC